MLENLEEYADPRLYDSEYGGYQGDFDFFLNLIQTGSLLDLGCGTGRITIPLAQKGLKVVGLDASSPMLTLASKKSQGLPIEWVQGDIRNFQLDQMFDLILMAGNTFQALLTEAEQLQMLACVRKHLKPSGLFVFNTRNPRESDHHTTSEFEYWHSFKDPIGEEVKVYGKQDVEESQQRVIYTTKRVWKNKETDTTIRLKFTTYGQLMRLLEQAGFEVTAVYGDDKKIPFHKDSPSIIPICKVRK
jgi:2-polyprenyl-3-methyl-5-hydroxy-6-metoxy-1,4-benzoquinol methylase